MVCEKTEPPFDGALPFSAVIGFSEVDTAKVLFPPYIALPESPWICCFADAKKHGHTIHFKFTRYNKTKFDGKVLAHPGDFECFNAMNEYAVVVLKLQLLG